MKPMSVGLVLTIICLVFYTHQVVARPAQGNREPIAKWEYRVLTQQQLLDLAKKDLAAGLNQLGNEGWELVTVQPAFIFKRPKYQDSVRLEELKRWIARGEAEVANWKDRAAWAQLMVKKGFMSEAQANADRASLRMAELALDRARKEFQAYATDQKKQVEK